MRILLVGGSKSGKSTVGQELAIALSEDRPRYYWAAMEPVDTEDDARIQRHIEDRAGLGFITVECGRDILEAPPLPENSTVLFDSITALLANEMFAGSVDREAGKKAEREIIELSRRTESFICVCDDVFRDGTSHEDLTDLYVESLAKATRAIAREFDVVCEAACGVLHVLKGSLPTNFKN